MNLNRKHVDKIEKLLLNGRIIIFLEHGKFYRMVKVVWHSDDQPVCNLDNGMYVDLLLQDTNQIKEIKSFL